MNPSVIFRLPVFLLSATFLLVLSACQNPPTDAKEDTGKITYTTKSETALVEFQKGLDLYDKFRSNEAREYIMKAIQADPDFASAHLYAALLAPSNAEFGKHMDKAYTLREKAGEGEKLVIELVQSWVDNDPERSKQLMQSVTEKYPAETRVYMWLGWAHSVRNEEAKSVEVLNQATKVDPNYVPAYMQLGYTYYGTQDFDKAKENFQKCVELMPEEAGPYNAMGDLMTRTGNHQEAIRNYMKAVELNKNFDYSQAGVGLNYVFMDQYDEARKAYQEAAELSPTPSRKIWNNFRVAESYLYEGKTTDFFNHMENVIAMAQEAGLPEMIADLHSRKCNAYIEGGNTEAAAQSLADCQKTVMESSLTKSAKEDFAKDAMGQEALIAAKKGEFDKAKEVAEKLKQKIEAGKDALEMQSYHLVMGRILHEEGKYEQALEHLAKVDDDWAITKYLKAKCYEATGKDDLAIQKYQELANFNQGASFYPFARAKAKEKVAKQTSMN